MNKDDLKYIKHSMNYAEKALGIIVLMIDSELTDDERIDFQKIINGYNIANQELKRFLNKKWGI